MKQSGRRVGDWKVAGQSETVFGENNGHYKYVRKTQLERSSSWQKGQQIYPEDMHFYRSASLVTPRNNPLRGSGTWDKEDIWVVRDAAWSPRDREGSKECHRDLHTQRTQETATRRHVTHPRGESNFTA